MTTYALSVQLDQYAGNVDENVCVLLFGFGSEYRRLSYDVCVKIFNDKIGEINLEVRELKDGFPYELDINANSLLVGLWDIDYLEETIEVWKNTYGNGSFPLELTYPARDYSTPNDYKDHTVKVLGFELIEIKEERTKLNV